MKSKGHNVDKVRFHFLRHLRLYDSELNENSVCLTVL